MAELEEPASDSGVPAVETFSYSAGSYDRLKSNEEELFELVRLSEVPIDKQLFKVILELLRLNVAPTAILQVLKSLKSQNTPDDFESRSPVPQRRIDSRSQQPTPPPHSSESFPTAPLASGTSLNGRGPPATSRGAERMVQSDQSEQSRAREDKEGHSRSGKSSSERHKSRHKVKGGSSRHRDTTGGSAKLKINELKKKNDPS